MLVQRTSLAAIGLVLCGSLSIGCVLDPNPHPGDDCDNDAGCGGCEEAGIAYCNTAFICACRPLGGTGGTGGTAGMGGSGGTAGAGGTGGGTPQPLVEDCTNSVTDDDDDLVDCQDVSDCACAPNCIDLFLGALTECGSRNLLTSPGFEDRDGGNPDPASWMQEPGFPTEAAVWGGDLADIVDVFPGLPALTPSEGSYMMQFQSTFDKPLPTASASSERVQLVDVSEEPERSRICGVASFARIDVDAQTDTAFAVVTAWYNGSPSDFEGFKDGSPTAITTECFLDGRCGNGAVEIPDRDAGGWKRVSSTAVLPMSNMPLTAVVMVRAQENMYNDDAPDVGPELDGHFVDDVGLFLVPDAPTQPCIDAMAPPP